MPLHPLAGIPRTGPWFKVCPLRIDSAWSRRTRMGLLVLALYSLAGLAGAFGAEPAPVAVLYPNVREPYRSVFLGIVQGIKEELKMPVGEYVTGDGEDLAALGGRLREQQFKSVIALGRLGLAVARQFPRDIAVVIGAARMPPPAEARELNGITLTPDPDILFDWLKTLTPGVKRVTTIYTRGQDEWGIERARDTAKFHGLSLNALPADNIREAATLYRDFLAQIKDGSDALWLPQNDTTLDESTLLPVILKEAWEKNLVVFSSNPEYVKRGILFALYPDNVGMGRSLGALALERARDGRKPPAILPLRDLFIAINARTAEHLGLRFSNQEKRQFNLVFPSP